MLNTTPTIPDEESFWLHTSGAEYMVLMVANSASEQSDRYPVTVVYRRYSDGTVWSRPLADWYRSFSPKPPERHSGAIDPARQALANSFVEFMARPGPAA